ncbi:response regulator receiver protein [Geobacter metallireducens RCH3]|uniref:Response receiver n=1 Tax=Geobacter metallireducens (strain ATCC 53774 / DSM 7210 / GS-15) TaxID=269799 RepID=Q39RJ2_GEOMG|nr:MULTISPECIES: response regulator [Geobacter]ABB33132.1 response receiver [Geobacter metallireducens GS-15]EHP87131.1 response regulator receiver protein [Geobacter metallireducens RCH3]MBT1075010.1 response regulator [Geobacter grbiciae]
MEELLIAEKDPATRQQMAEHFIKEGYSVTVTDSLPNTLSNILKKVTRVVLLGAKFDELPTFDLIDLMKKCNQKLAIILVSDELPLPLLRKVRSSGIFYHALKPSGPEDVEEICQAVRCAFGNGMKGHAAR